MPHSAPSIGRSEHHERAIWSCREHSPCSPCSSNLEKERLLIHRNNQLILCSNLDSTVYAQAILSALTYFVGAVITVCVVRLVRQAHEQPKKSSANQRGAEKNASYRATPRCRSRSARTRPICASSLTSPSLFSASASGPNCSKLRPAGVLWSRPELSWRPFQQPYRRR